eukprot:6185199-Pleurochrysis_carterae.AAC.3
MFTELSRSGSPIARPCRSLIAAVEGGRHVLLPSTAIAADSRGPRCALFQATPLLRRRAQCRVSS